MLKNANARDRETAEAGPRTAISEIMLRKICSIITENSEIILQTETAKRN